MQECYESEAIRNQLPTPPVQVCRKDLYKDPNGMVGTYIDLCENKEKLQEQDRAGMFKSRYQINRGCNL
jgi:hypothetical protein